MLLSSHKLIFFTCQGVYVTPRTFGFFYYDSSIQSFINNKLRRHSLGGQQHSSRPGFTYSTVQQDPLINTCIS